MARVRALAAAAGAALSAAQVSVIQSTASGQSWQPQPDLTWGPDFESALDVTVNASQTYQEIIGFGCAFTDSSAFNWHDLMNATSQQRFIEAHWGASGLGYTAGRVPISSPGEGGW